MALSSSSPSTPSTTSVAATVAGKMPNMARTLLLNANGSDRPDPSFYGEEYVPPYFASVDLPHELILVRRALFGTTPDTAGMNYSVWQYMRTLHSTEYVGYVTDLDDRITYMGDKSLLNYSYEPSIEPDEGVQLVGDSGLGGADGRMRAAWNLSLSGGSATVECLTVPRLESFNVTVTDGLTSFIPLAPYNTYQARIDISVSARTWLIDYIAEPGEDMGLVARAASLGNIGASAYEALFPRRSPYTLFKELWEQHPLLPYKLSGALLALIYLTNEYRAGTING